MTNESPKIGEPPKNVSSEGIKVLTNLLDLAQSNKMISAGDVNSVLRIIKANPSRRLSNIARRLSTVKNMVAEVQSFDRRLIIVTEKCDEELNEIKEIAEQLPNFNKEGVGE